LYSIISGGLGGGVGSSRLVSDGVEVKLNTRLCYRERTERLTWGALCAHERNGSKSKPVIKIKTKKKGKLDGCLKSVIKHHRDVKWCKQSLNGCFNVQNTPPPAKKNQT
jgi:hypothetical protein